MCTHARVLKYIIYNICSKSQVWKLYVPLINVRLIEKPQIDRFYTV